MDGFGRYPLKAVLVSSAAGMVLLAGCASTGPEESIPESLEAGPPDAGSGVGDRTLGPDDLIQVQVFGAEELSGELRVTSGGEISMPLLGPVRAEGLTARELERELEAVLGETYLRDPQVSVEVLEARAQEVATVYVVGEVRRPGGFPLERGEPVSVIQALALAEGLEPTASKGRAKIIRNGGSEDPQELPVDLDEILEGVQEDPLLQHRDILVVPSSRPRSVVRGVWDAFLRMFRLRDIR